MRRLLPSVLAVAAAVAGAMAPGPAAPGPQAPAAASPGPAAAAAPPAATVPPAAPATPSPGSPPAPAGGSSDPAAALAEARAAARRARLGPAPAAWSEAAAAAERALRLLSPAWAAAVDAGGDAGAAAARVGPEGAEALYWLARASWEGARARGFAAVLAVKPFAMPSMERVAALDERLDHAGPRRALGSWRAGLPAAVGGGAEAARAEFRRARELAPGWPWNAVEEAATLRVLLQDRKGFEALLAEVLSGPPGGEVPPEEAEAARRAARDLLARADRLFR
jgi:hypothetical protein